MRKSKHLSLQVLVALMLCFSACGQPLRFRELDSAKPGNLQTAKYIPLLAGQRVAVLTNASGMVGNTSLVDTLLKLKVNLKKVFVPEHGFRGEADAGVKVQSGKDKKTGLPIVSLYGKNKKPTATQLADIDVVIYDIQDLGVRFYTYISTMSYMMEACARSGKKMIVLDRPNPNGFYIDGPVLEPEFRSFLGLHPVPIVYGMTCGEYAKMVNGEGWLEKGITCDLTVVPMENYDRSCTYKLPVKPSPNIPNERAVLLYPGLGLFEGTAMSLGRGTDFPFQMVGHPGFPDSSFSFVPKPNPVNKQPRYSGQTCNGLDLRTDHYIEGHPHMLGLQWLLHVYNIFNHPAFFEENFNYHAGNATLQQQVKDRLPEPSIRESWKEGIARFKAVRKKYLLYEDFPGN